MILASTVGTLSSKTDQRLRELVEVRSIVWIRTDAPGLLGRTVLAGHDHLLGYARVGRVSGWVLWGE